MPIDNVTERYYGPYENAHLGKVKKAGLRPLALRQVEEANRCIPTKSWAAMIRMVYPKCRGTMKVVALITDFGAVDRIISHLGLAFVAEKPLPSDILEQVELAAAEEGVVYF